jgi:hypothetical protein
VVFLSLNSVSFRTRHVRSPRDTDCPHGEHAITVAESAVSASPDANEGGTARGSTAIALKSYMRTLTEHVKVPPIQISNRRKRIRLSLNEIKTEAPSILPPGEGTWKPPGIVKTK